MPDPVLNAIDCPCACGSKARVTASPTGSLTIFCGTCKFQGFAKSPKAVSSLQARIGTRPADPARPAEAPKPAAGADFLSRL